MIIEWLFSTEPNPRTSGMNAAGGWKLHVVDTEGVAACGMRPAHGWGIDLFITDKCTRCKKAIGNDR